MSAPVMIGMDNTYNRPFIAIRSKQHFHGEEDTDTREDTHYAIYRQFCRQNCSVDVMFQRYTDDTNTWSSASSNTGILSRLSGHFLKKGILCDDFIAMNVMNVLYGGGSVFSHSRLASDDPSEVNTHQYTLV
jgi:hypothetical protein